jgi:ribonucleoside-diphosphate reductase beta chain
LTVRCFTGEFSHLPCRRDTRVRLRMWPFCGMFEGASFVGMETVKRDSYMTITPRGLDWQSVPMRLFQKSKRLGVWDPAAINLEQDKRDWHGMDEQHRDGLIGLGIAFLAGEEAVTLDIMPLVNHVARAGRIEEEIYLTSFLWEEAKHVEFFRRWFDAVPGVTEDLNQYLGPAYKTIFYEELPTAMARLWTDDSREALAEALVTYNMIVEGVLAETGYYSYARQLEISGHMPGLQEGLRYIRRDESRHIRFGVYMLQVLLNEDPGVWGTVEARMGRLIPLAIALTSERDPEFEERYGAGGYLVPPEETAAFAQTQFQRRMKVLERARRQSRAELDRELSAEMEAES